MHPAWDRPRLTDMVTNVTGPAAMILWRLAVSVAELRSPFIVGSTFGGFCLTVSGAQRGDNLDLTIRSPDEWK